MISKRLLPRILLLALVALERFVSGMCSDVVLQSYFPRKTHGTLGTCKRLLAGVHQHVRFDLASLFEAHRTQRARKRPFAGVDPRVYPEMAGRRARRAAPRVWARMQVRMNPRVDLERVGGGTGRVARGAHMYLLACVCAVVRLALVRQPERAFTPRVVAFVGFLARVDARVHLELRGFVERHAAPGVGAGVRLGAGVHAQVDAQVVHAGENLRALVAGVHGCWIVTQNFRSCRTVT